VQFGGHFLIPDASNPKGLLGAAAKSNQTRATTPLLQNNDNDSAACKSFALSKRQHQRATSTVVSREAGRLLFCRNNISSRQSNDGRSSYRSSEASDDNDETEEDANSSNGGGVHNTLCSFCFFVL
jgi:hypothetical protein